MREMRGYLCEATLEGIFTGIYDAWASGLGHGHVRLFLRDQYEPQLFVEYQETAPDPEKAEKVARGIRRGISAEAFRLVCQALLSCDPGRADAVYRFLIRGFRYGAPVTGMLQLPEVSRIFALSRRTANEAHHYLEFLRFEQLDNGALFARIEPKSRILTLVAPHFTDRLSGEDWIIFDGSHGEAAVHRAMEDWFLAEVTEEEAERFRDGHRTGDGCEELWRIFFHAVSIGERENPRCQRSFLPIWMRRHMTEFQ